MVTHLAEMLVQVGQSSRDDSSVAVALRASCNSERFSAASLSIGEDRTVVTCQDTETHNKDI